MTDSPRIQELRRRVELDPASLAFAPLAEELRRGGRLDEAISVCRTGLEQHPEYVSARATLGRALLDVGDTDNAFTELAAVLTAAPEHLAALRGIAEIHSRRGEIAEALDRSRTALALARSDADLERLIAELEAKLAAGPAPTAAVTPAPAESATRAEAPAPVDTPAAETPANPQNPVLQRLENLLAAVVTDRERRDAQRRS